MAAEDTDTRQPESPDQPHAPPTESALGGSPAPEPTDSTEDARIEPGITPPPDVAPEPSTAGAPHGAAPREASEPEAPVAAAPLSDQRRHRAHSNMHEPTPHPIAVAASHRP